MSDEELEKKDPRERPGWFAGRTGEVERRVEEACHRAILKVRGVAAEEIRALSKRVERMHELLDHLERVVESQADGETAEEEGSDGGP